VTPAGGQAMLKRSGYTLSILRKEEDGRWLLVRDANLLAPSMNNNMRQIPVLLWLALVAVWTTFGESPSPTMRRRVIQALQRS
jgi:hypothetical protein